MVIGGGREPTTFTVNLVKPFGIGFQRCHDYEGAMVVQVKGCSAKEQGVRPGLILVALNGLSLAFDDLNMALRRIPTGVDAVMTFEAGKPSPAGSPAGGTRADLRSQSGSFFGSFNSESSSRMGDEGAEPVFDENGEWQEELQKPIGVAFLEERGGSGKSGRFEVGSVLVERRISSSRSMCKSGDYLVELNGERLTGD